MQRTLIAVFDKHSDAQSAIDALVSSGFPRPGMRLSEGDPTGGASAIGDDQAPAAPRGGGSFADGIKNFLGTIFGTDNSEYVQQYSDAVTRGHHVLTLMAGDELEAERACAIVKRFGPVDIDARAAQWSDDACYLAHYHSTHAGSGGAYGDYAPAYQFGADMAASERYRGRPWADVNAEIARDWESRHPGAAWGRFEASVRYGWERRGA